MLEHTKKRHTDVVEARFIGSVESIRRLKTFASEAGAIDISDRIPWREVFPESIENMPGTLLSGYRHREGLTQEVLSEKAQIPRRHISEMENGKRPIGKENAKKLGRVLGVDYRMFL